VNICVEIRVRSVEDKVATRATHLIFVRAISSSQGAQT
jgi:hypothetical protein